jgi:hypothetical protein
MEDEMKNDVVDVIVSALDSNTSESKIDLEVSFIN